MRGRILVRLTVPAAAPTRLDVEYAVHEGTGQIRALAMSGTFEPDELEEVDLGTVQYLKERTGVSPRGLMVRGAGIDISGWRGGDYIVRITIEDLITGQECASAVAFRRPGCNSESRSGG